MSEHTKPSVSRTTKPKVRTGCKTCKSRRVKCDERKPACFRCERHGSKCEGYAASSQHASHAVSRPSSRPLIPRHSRTTNPQVWRGPSSVLFSDDTQGRYFAFFYSDIVPRVAISGPFAASDFWRGILLRECWLEPALTSAIAAIGALSKALLSGKSHWVSEVRVKPGQKPASGSGAAKPNPDYVFALQHYQKALRQMSSIKDLRHILLACLLVFTFENYNERPDLGVGHIQVGFQLLKRWLKGYKSVRSATTVLSPAPEIVEHDLLRCYSMVDMHIVTFANVTATVVAKSLQLQGGPPTHPELYVPAILEGGPETFENLQEARMHLYRVIGATFKAVSVASTSKDVQERGDAAYASRARKLEAWYAAFAAFWSRARILPLSHPESHYIMILRLMAKHCEIMLAGQRPPGDSECVYDEYLADFEEVLLIARKMHLELRTTKQIFVGNGIVSPLFAVATKCRDRRIREESLELLKRMEKREGVWDSRLAALAAEWLRDLEEDGLEGNWIPEEKRVRLSSVVLDAENYLMHLECTRRRDSTGHYMFYKRTVIKWD